MKIKIRCQCPPPEAIPDPDPEDPNFVWLNAELHFREATGTCAGCGRGICSKCGTHKQPHFSGWVLYKNCCPGCFHIIISGHREIAIKALRDHIQLVVAGKKEPVDGISKQVQSGD